MESIGSIILKFLSLFSFGLGLLCSAYLFYEWLKHRRVHAFPLFWSVGLLIFNIFNVPTVWANIKPPINISDWIGFYTLTIPLVFLGWILIYIGVIHVRSLSEKHRLAERLFFGWFLASLIFYYFRFSLEPPKGYILSFVGIMVFFLPIHILALISLWRWLRAKGKYIDRRIRAGIAVMIVALIVSVIRYFITINSLINYPPKYWFLSIISFDMVFILRNVVVVLLASGFFLVHKYYFFEDSKDETAL